MAKALKAGALWLAIMVLVWLITIWRWQSSGHDARTADIVWQLLVLPLALTGFFLAVLWGVVRLREQATAPIVAVSVPSASHGAAMSAKAASRPVADPLSDEAQRRLSACVLAEAVTLAAGGDALSAWSSLQTQRVRPQLDSVLQDVDGMPVFTSRVADLDVRDWLDAHAELAQGAGQASVLPEPVLRGLALLEAPLHQMLLAIGDLGPLPDDEHAASAHAHKEARSSVADMGMKAHLSGMGAPVNVAQAQARAAVAPQLTVRLLLPSHWSAEDRAVAVDWVRSQCRGLLDWAEARRAKDLLWLTEPIERPEDLWQEIDRQMVQWSRDARPELLLVLAVDTAVNEHGVERMQSVGELFTSSHQTGKVPGEAAAGLLLANAHWQGLAEVQAASSVRMWRPVRATRDKSADAAGRVGATALGVALQQAASLNQADKDAVLVVSDADHRASRTAELFEALQDAMPGVDPMLAVTRVGEACGEMGLARTLVPSVLACAALRAGQAADQVALAAHVQSSHERVVVALAPWRAGEPAAA